MYEHVNRILRHLKNKSANKSAIRLATGLTIGLAGLASVGCASTTQQTSSPSTSYNLLYQPSYFDYRLPSDVDVKCQQRQNCPDISVQYVQTNHVWLDKLINANINRYIAELTTEPQASDSVSAPSTNLTNEQVKSKLDAFARAQFDDLPISSNLSYGFEVTPNYLGHMGKVELFEISAYLNMGGAHPMPYQEYVMVDLSLQKQLGLDDLLVEGKKPAYQTLVHDAYRNWIQQMDMGEAGSNQVEQYEKSWPFTLSDNVLLTDKGVVTTYQAYEIAPYVMGQPELLVEYGDLQGILKAAYLP